MIKNDNDRCLHTKSRRYKLSDERKKNYFYRSFRKNQIIDRLHTHLKLCLLLFCEFQIFVRRYQKKQIHESKSTMRFFELCKKNEQAVLNVSFRFQKSHKASQNDFLETREMKKRKIEFVCSNVKRTFHQTFC